MNFKRGGPVKDVALLSTVEQVDLISRGEISSRELTEHCIDRIERRDGEINAVVTRDFETALIDADAADSAQAAGQALGRVHGVTITEKDALETTG